MARLDDIRVELAEIQVLLDELPEDDFEARASLRGRQQELRAEGDELRRQLAEA